MGFLRRRGGCDSSLHCKGHTIQCARTASRMALSLVSASRDKVKPRHRRWRRSSSCPLTRLSSCQSQHFTLLSQELFYPSVLLCLTSSSLRIVRCTLSTNPITAKRLLDSVASQITSGGVQLTDTLWKMKHNKPAVLYFTGSAHKS